MMSVFSGFSLLFLLPLCFASLAVGATLPEDEVQALRDIAHTIGKKNWNYSVDPCDGKSNWNSSQKNVVTCNCSFVNHTCHVVSIILKEQNLSGIISADLVRLPYLQQIDFTRNYLNGTIPKQLGTLNLVNISFLGNRLTGPIPKELGNITTLKALVLEFNQLSGSLPLELGNLTQIEKLHLTSNNFTGELPATLARLTTLKELVMQGSGLSGPIPSGISILRNLTDLRVTDLNGSDSRFPQLNNMTNLLTLILRSVNIIGSLPENLGKLTNLEVLDVSYNKLTGPIPSIFGDLPHLNMLDLSYNNLSIGNNIEELQCQRETVGNVSCLSNIPCKTSYSMHINCGGNLVTDGKKTYDDDTGETTGPASFHNDRGKNWALINNGHFFDTDRLNYYNVTNSTKLVMENVELYMNARVSPTSLTYYGFCLGNGNYTVKLHFAEIMFTDDKTYSSLGRRVFDIYIQRNLVAKDFNIAKEAGGVGKAVIKNFTVVVTSNALEIRLYWAGKGTTSIPFRSIYGPLISAISVDPNFIPPSESGSSSISIIRVVVAVVVAGAIIILIFGILWWKRFLGWERSVGRELKGLESQTSLFTLRQIKAATNNFDKSLKIGEGGFGLVYKGVLSDGTVVAVKQLSTRSRQGSREFVNEIGLISALQHPCLVKLYGCCMEEDQLLLIYEYMENNSLAHALFAKNDDSEKCQLRLDWQTRHRICVGIAKGLAYLHEESKLKIVHRDIKANNVHLLKENGNLMEIVDKRLGEHFNKTEAMMMINVALLCTKVSLALRPTMSLVVSMLEGRTRIQEVVLDKREVLDDDKFEIMQQYYQHRGENNIIESQNLSDPTGESSKLFADTSSSGEQIERISLTECKAHIFLLKFSRYMNESNKTNTTRLFLACHLLNLNLQEQFKLLKTQLSSCYFDKTSLKLKRGGGGDNNNGGEDGGGSCVVDNSGGGCTSDDDGDDNGGGGGGCGDDNDSGGNGGCSGNNGVVTMVVTATIMTVSDDNKDGGGCYDGNDDNGSGGCYDSDDGYGDNGRVVVVIVMTRAMVAVVAAAVMAVSGRNDDDGGGGCDSYMEVFSQRKKKGKNFLLTYQGNINYGELSIKSIILIKNFLKYTKNPIIQHNLFLSRGLKEINSLWYDAIHFRSPTIMMGVFSGFPLLFLLPFCFASLAFGATLPEDEVQALRDIAHTIGKKNWNYSVDPCTGKSNWNSSEKNVVTCNCSFVNHTCHVVSIILKEQNLSGIISADLVRLPYLQQIDFTRNYLNGTIPKQLGTLNLVNISFLGNRLTGPIPKELGNITTLKALVLEFNQLSGSLPLELGNLTQIEKLHLTSNNFTGELPATLARLTTLKELVMQGSGLSGPIPSGISILRNLTDLRVTDLNGSDSWFPQLNNMTNLVTLILRSCNIIGSLPENLGKLTNLEVLDVSYNKLTGPIPSIFGDLRHLDMLDLSYNNLSIGNNIEELQCRQETVGNVSCLSNIPCKTSYSLYINCGGNLVTDGRKTYDDDTGETTGPASFHNDRGKNWALINNGHFFDTNRLNYYNVTNSTKLVMENVELYMNARVSPTSLTYYGFCLGNGIYTVKLHFAEIMFTDDKTYSSLGRRVFDIYIQRNLVAKDFNIAKEAGGVGKAVIKNFTVVVTSNALEIRLYWAGKGTTSIPFRSVYGPLISAISVDPNFIPPSESGTSSISIIRVVVVVVVAGAIIILIFGILWWKRFLGWERSVGRELKGLESQTSLFTLRQIKAATNNFDKSLKIGEGGFGPVYKGVLSDGTVVAVKQLSARSRQGSREFVNEIGLISALQHPCLVKLYGCCMEEDQLLLIYEYMENNSLAHALFAKNDDSEKCQLRLDWQTRHRICVGIAKGLAYLHEESKLKIVHRDIKANNVLLDKDLNPKISDFGLAKLNDGDKTHLSTRIAGTYGYIAPEYAMHGYLTDKADVYSFGIVALEIVSGMSNTISQPTEECFSLIDRVHLLKENGNLMEIVDKRLGEHFNKTEAMMMINVALLCTKVSLALRPTMSLVVSMLEGRTHIQEVVLDKREVLDDVKF
ncbi:putative leucine-rich repeat receptor-like serine/threonine-protein kinase [Glycine soja]